ncbi:RTA1 like protein-domain-containing protein [Macrophomina phaseolina]|uniref:RTA1 like protein-domain-containing protein n=1 Tax=Macrophomina phaseolina TaxID=35725 RepID=A0ABQ8GSV7_9PEZI|nr:RTA1 like protein-domain-containing protein [Macrophomina phaseolina]
MAEHEIPKYIYEPNSFVCGGVAALFGSVAGFHLWQNKKSNTWWFLPFALCGIAESLGWVSRFFNARQAPDYETFPYAAQFSIILASPVLLSMSMYLTMARIVTLTGGEAPFPIKMKWFTKAFLGGDSSSLGMMGIGGAFFAGSSDPTKGIAGFAAKMVPAGLGHHIIFSVVFIIVVMIFHIRIMRNPTVRSMIVGREWIQFLWLFYISNILLIARNVLRLAMFIQGPIGPLSSKEIYFVLMDSLPIFLIMAMFGLRHPGLLANSRGSVLLDEERPEESTEIYEMRK